MSTINNSSPLGSLALASLASTAGTGTTSASAIGQSQFLELMVAQLKNQDPTQPLQSGEFLGQLAQFGTVSGIQQMQTSLSDLTTAMTSNQALMASGLVGRQVLVPGGVGMLSAGGSLNGSVTLGSSASNVGVTVSDAGGQVVRHIQLGQQAAGDVSFSWDGTTDSGTTAAPGVYTVKAQAYSGTNNYAVSTSVMNRVDSVTLGNGQGVTLNLAGIGAVSLSDVKQIF